ncbi:MAG: hypothetical protein RIS09_1044 [Actinomycetota bacterium]
MRWGIFAAIGIVTILVLLLNVIVAPEEKLEGLPLYIFLGVMILSSILAMAFSKVELLVYAEEFEVKFSSVFSRTIPWSHVASVRVVKVRPRDWGGWGFRWKPKSVGIVMRKQSGLRFDFASGRSLTMTLDHVDEGIDVIKKVLDSYSEK